MLYIQRPAATIRLYSSDWRFRHSYRNCQNRGMDGKRKLTKTTLAKSLNVVCAGFANFLETATGKEIAAEQLAKFPDAVFSSLYSLAGSRRFPLVLAIAWRHPMLTMRCLAVRLSPGLSVTSSSP